MWRRTGGRVQVNELMLKIKYAILLLVGFSRNGKKNHFGKVFTLTLAEFTKESIKAFLIYFYQFSM